MNITNDDNKIDFYKWVNTKVIEKLISKHFENMRPKILVLYDFASDYFDVLENKVRVGVNKITEKKIQILTTKIKNAWGNNTFNIIDMRLTLKFIKNHTQLELLFNFMNSVLSDNGFIFGFINVHDDGLEQLEDILTNSMLYIKHNVSLDEYIGQFKKDHFIENQDFSKESIIVIEKEIKK